MTCHSAIEEFTSAFSPITLEQLNAKAEMMARIDNKYVVQSDDLLALAPDLSEAFDILDIEDQRAFTYDTRYFDDVVCSAYYEHHQGRRRGFKVRARQYVNAGLCFLEVKVKGPRGQTEKYRMPYDPNALMSLSPEAEGFASTTYSRQYDKPFKYQLRTSLDVRYQRITLVARAGGERMTIDTDLSFQSEDHAVNTGTRVFIVETKSANGRGLADRLLRAQGERPTKRCSKYCIGMVVTGRVSKFNRFLPTMRKLGLAVPPQRLGDWAASRSDLRILPDATVMQPCIAAE